MFAVYLAVAALGAAVPCQPASAPGQTGVCCAPTCQADSSKIQKPETASYLIKIIDLAAALGTPKPEVRAPAPLASSATTAQLAPSSTPTASCASLETILSPDKSATIQSDPRPALAEASVPNAKTVVALLGNPIPLTLASSGSRILVYSSTMNVKVYTPALRQVEAGIKMLPAPKPSGTARLRQMELAVPHGAHLDGLSGIDDKFKVELEYPGTLKVSETAPVSCAEWLAVIESIQKSSLGSVKEPRVSRLFYLQAANRTASAILATDSGNASQAGVGVKSKSDAGSPSKPASSTGADTSEKGSQAIANPEEDGSSAINSSPKSSAPSGSAPSTDHSLPVKSLTTSSPEPSAAGKSLSVKDLDQDLLIFGKDQDQEIGEAKRVVAMLDLPRPEMIINAWILQVSTSDPNRLGQFGDIARRYVGQNNDVLQRGILAGWLSLRKSIEQGNYFDPDFYTYLTARYISDSAVNSTSGDAEINRAAKGICPYDQYCLGYTILFNPLKPRLTDLLLAMIASQNFSANMAAIDAAEGKDLTGKDAYSPCTSRECTDLRQRLGLYIPLCKGNCKAPDASNDTRASSESMTPSSCEVRDIEGLVDSAGEEFLKGRSPQLQLECFRSAIVSLTGNSAEKVPPGQALARAALADFLFNYKMSQQYPGEFAAYDLTQSADSLNSSLGPMIDAFNRDIAAYQDYLNNVISMAENYKPSRSVTFTNSGLVSVRTVSMNQAKVSSTTQSFLDASRFPDLATLAANISPGQSGSGKTPLATGVLESLTPIEAQVLTGALKSFQTSQAQIGRAIDLRVVPRSLSGASSAEMDVTLNVDDQGTPTRYTGSSSDKLNLSRVATHDIATHVRVDSLKLFEVSAIGAKLTLSRAPIPLILPGVELPYIGSIVGLPRKPAEEYHGSVAIMSAIVVPTASDLAYGLQFVYDRVVLGPKGLCRRPWEDPDGLPYCRVAAAASQNDLAGSITSFHRVKKECIATGGQDAYGLISHPGQKGDSCGTGMITFDTLIQLAN